MQNKPLEEHFCVSLKSFALNIVLVPEIVVVT